MANERSTIIFWWSDAAYIHLKQLEPVYEERRSGGELSSVDDPHGVSNKSSYSVSAGEIGPFSEPCTIRVEMSCSLTYLRLGSPSEYNQKLQLSYDIQVLPKEGEAKKD